MKRLNILAHSDGACKRNPGKGGWGSTYCHDVTAPDGHVTNVRWSRCGGKRKTTNNEMELTAFLQTLRMCPKNSDIVIVSDSKYVLEPLIKGGKLGNIGVKERRLSKVNIDGVAHRKREVVFTGYISSWICKGWKKTNNRPPENLELWKLTVQEIYDHIESGSNIKCQWVKGHSGEEGNEIADLLSNTGIP